MCADFRSRVPPLIVFHGDRDTTVNVVNAHQVFTQWLEAQGCAGDGSVDRTPGADARLLIVKGRQPGGYAYTRFIFRAGGRTILEKWIVHCMAHAWSGGSSDGSHTDPHGPVASVQMLRFFAQHPMNPSTSGPSAA